MSNGNVTRYVTEGVTAPQPNPTQPNPISTSFGSSSIHRQGSSASRREPAGRTGWGMDAAARTIGGGL